MSAKGLEIIRWGDKRRPKGIPSQLGATNEGGVLQEDGTLRGGTWRACSCRNTSNCRGDKDGQYLAPDPMNPTGEWKKLQRATTFVKNIDYMGDPLINYNVDHGLKGLALSPDLIPLVAATLLADRRTQTYEEKRALQEVWTEIRNKCWAASGKDQAADNGTEIHAGTEWVDHGGSLDTLPPEAGGQKWRPQIEAYIALRDGPHGFEVFEELIERTVVHMEYEVAGTFDRIVLVHLHGYDCPNSDGTVGCDGRKRFRVLDVKSGDTEFKRDTIGRQMLLYATADGIWDSVRQEYQPMPEDLDVTLGLVVEIPWFIPEGEQPRATLVPVKFERSGGAPGLQACAEVKGLKRGSSTKQPPIATAYPEAPLRAIDPVHEAIVKATTQDELMEVYRNAKTAGTWNVQIHKPIATKRKAELAPA